MVSPEPYGLPKRKAILWGDDNWGTVLDESAIFKNKKGVEMKRYLVIPGEHLMKQYPILQKPGVLKNYGGYYALWREYPTYWINDTNPSRTQAITRVYCAFDGKQTSETKRFEVLVEENKQLQQEIENLKLSNIYLMEENRVLLGEKEVLIRKVMVISDLAKGGKNEPSEENELEQV